MRLCLSILAAFVLLTVSTGTQTAANEGTLRCNFEVVASNVLSVDTARAVRPEPMLDVAYTDIDVAAGTALISVPTGTSSVAVLSSGPATLHFVDAPATGSFTVTTIFLSVTKPVAAGGFSYRVSRAVMSRHLTTLKEEALVAQYYGTCKG